MKWVLVGIVFLGSVSFADIPSRPLSVLGFEGADAIELYNSLNVQRREFDQTRTHVGWLKVWRSKSEKSQIACQVHVTKSGTSSSGARCVAERSLDGRPVPQFVPENRDE